MSTGMGLNGPATSSAVMVYEVSIGAPSAASAAGTASGARLRARAKAATARRWLLPSRPSISPGEKCARSSITCIQSRRSLAGTLAAASGFGDPNGVPADVPMGDALAMGSPPGDAPAYGEAPSYGDAPAYG